MKSKLKYYFYVSESKVNMLFSQIPVSIRSKIEAEVKLNLPLMNVAFTEKQFDDSLYSKLGVVTEYIEKNSGVGSIGAPQEYFKDVAFLKWSHIHEGIVFWGGKKNDVALGLGGSAKYLLGSTLAPVTPGIVSHSPWLASFLIKELQLRILSPELPELLPDDVEYRAASATEWWAQELSKGFVQKFEFLAKTLLHRKIADQEILLGTPIYVSLSEKGLS